MRSIRLSLIVYFLVLLALALGGVSWFVYETSAQALLGKQASTKDLIQAQYKTQCDDIKAALDLRLRDQAQALARIARSSKVHFEPYFALGALATRLQPQGYLNASVWIASGLHPNLSSALYWNRPQDIIMEHADDIVRGPSADRHQDQEYFQIYSRHGRTQQRSEKMGTRSLSLDAKIIAKADLLVDQFDNVEPEPGWKLRRVTLMAPVPRFRPSSWNFDWLDPTKKLPFPRKGPPLGPPSGSVVFIQYASETAVMDKKLRDFLAARDAKFARLELDMHDALWGLRLHLLWICLATFAGILAGGLVLVRLGLAPLARLSEAVSQVSEKDFRLKVNAQDLPTELQPIAARLTRTLEQLQRAFAREKQAAADISHELRTPLAAMMTTLELSLRKARTAAEYREMLEDIRSSGAQMAHLVERLLALARLDAGADALRVQEIDARDIARQCTNLIRPLAEARGLALTLHAPDPVPLRVDPDKLREVLNNLLHNAVEYNRPLGAIDLNVARVNGHVQLAISDSGIGMTPEQRQHIFERFFRADPSRHADTPHAGLGLAIVKSYVDLMGGTIGVDSSAQGSTFTIELPVP